MIQQHKANELWNETANLAKQTGSQEAFKGDNGDGCIKAKPVKSDRRLRPVNNQREKLQGNDMCFK